VKIKDQPQSDRLLLLTGVVIAAFLVGLSLALLNQVILPILFRGEAVRLPRFGPVQTAVGEVSVIKPPVLHPGDGTITLMFGPMAALGQAPSTGVQLYQQTDVVMTSLQGGWANSAPTQETEEASTSENGSNTQTLSNGTLQELRANGVDLVMMTGSHPPLSAIEQLQQNSIYAVGTGISPEAPRRPVILEVKGKRIAYLGYSDATLQTETENAVGDRQLKHQLSTDIRALRDQVDWIVVGYDWSQPLKTYPEVWQTDLTRFAIDQGADLVVGYRPEAMQGAEIYQGRPIVYSLGNSVGYAQSQSSDRDTVMLKVSLQGQQMQLEFVPIQVIQGQPTIATGEVGQQILSYLQQTSSLFDQPLRSPFVLDTRNSAASAPAPLLVPPAVSPPFTQ
jgi:poly-gamma-glutamate synthesis protein (capsule biosynthesis protein)